MSHRPRFILSPALGIHVATWMSLAPDVKGMGSLSRLRRELATASRRARRTGRIAVPLAGARLTVWRAQLFDRPHDVVTRDDGQRQRVVGIVPTRGRATTIEGACSTCALRSARARRMEDEVFAGTRGDAPMGEEAILSEREATLLALELAGVEDEHELDQFLGKVFKSVSRAAKGVAGAVSSAGKSIGKVLDKVNKFVPVGSILSLTPAGMAIRAGKSLGRIAKGENVFKVAGNFVKSGLKDVGQVMQLASTVASFIPGVGTGVAAALGAAGALAQGRPITEAVLAAARSALPGGALAATAFDVASSLARGKSLSEAALTAARNQLPGGAAARAAFDAGLALAQGKKLQDVALTTAGRMLPPSPFASTALSFAGKVARGQNVQKAALSAAGGALMQRAKAGAAAQGKRLAAP